MLSNRRFRRSGQAKPVRSGYRPLMETFEKRELLTASPLFIQGTAFVDPTASGILTATDAPLANATVNLYQGTTTTAANLVGTTTTGTDGGYVFTTLNAGKYAGSASTALTAGVYTLVESATGYTNTAASGFSEIDPYTITQPNAITVTVEPATLTTTNLGLLYPLNGATYTVKNSSGVYTAAPTSISPVAFSTANGSTVLNASFATLCVDAGHSTTGGQSFTSTTDPQSALPSGGQIGYLFNQFVNPTTTAASFPANLSTLSTSALSLNDLQAGVQVAVWDLLYNSGAATGVFNLTGPAGPTTSAELGLVQSIATLLIKDTAGLSEKVAVLDASSNGAPSDPNAPHTSANTQSVLAGESFNFGNIVAPDSLSGIAYVDANNSGSYVKGDPLLANVPVTLTGTTIYGLPVTLTTTTSSTGAYSFTSLAPGTYTVTETTPPAGYTLETANAGIISGTTPIDGTASVGSISAITLGANSAGINYNFPHVGSSISGTVYVDATGNGLTTANQPPAGSGDTPEAGVTVNLYNSSGTLIGTTTTAADGTYSFTGLPYGTYGVAEVVPSTQYQTGPNSLTYTDTTSPAAPVSTNNNFSNYLACNMKGLTIINYVVTTPAGVSTTVTNLRGNTAQGDTVTANFSIAPGSVPVQLSLVAYEAPTPYYSSSNAYLQVITSVATGTYGPGTYSQTVVLPNSYYQVDFVCGAPLTQLELNGNHVDYNYENRLDSADNGGTQAYALSSLSGTVYVDNNGNDLFGSGDTGLGGITVYLANATGSAVLATTTTASNGTYTFNNLAPGTYVVAEVPPSGYTGETSNVGSIGGTGTYTASNMLELTTSIALNSNTAATGYNFGQYVPATVSGTVYVDANANDALDSGEVGLPGITVTLLNASGTAVATTTSSSTGTYSFTGLTPGVYSIQEGATTGYNRENANPGTNGGTPWWGAITGFTLASGNNDTGNNFGQYQSATVSGTVYVDANANDKLDSGEVGLPGITVTLLNASGTAVATTTSSSTGTYSFTGLTPGVYSIQEGATTGYNRENANPGTNGGTPWWGAITGFTLASGNNDTGNNFGQYISSSISGTVYVDASGSGLTAANVPAANSGDTPEAGVTINLYNSAGVFIASTVTAANGTYSFNNLPVGTYGVTENIPGGQYQTGPNSVSYVVSTTAASPNSTNDNFANYMACNSTGLANVKYFVNGVQVPTLGGYTSQGATVTVTFDNNGTSPIMLSLATYESQFNYFTIYNVSQQVLVGNQSGTFAPGKGYSLTVTLPNSDYQVDFVCGAPIVHFGPGGSNVDYGEEGRFINGTIGGNNLPAASTLSGLAYIDNNGNGTYGSGDTVLANVPITITGTTYVGAELVGTTLTPITVSYTTTTSSTGTYSFAGLAPGTYTVTETVPSGYFGETANVGTVGGSAVVGSVSSIALNSNTAATGYNFGDAKPSSISGTVYADNNGNSNLDCFDAGIGGVTVYLYNAAGTVQLASTTTASNGTYTFGNLAPGTYQVATFAPTGYTGETPGAGTSGGSTSYNSTTKLASISSITLISNTTATSYNFGEKANSTGLGCYQTGSTNYWCGSAGQSLINCMNGSSGAKVLGNWLSSLLPNICGSYAGKTNSQVCSSFQSLCWTNPCNANIVATALAAYCTSSDLAGCNAAANCGFQMVAGGSGNCTVSVGNTFSGFGGPCGTASLFQLLIFADSQSTSWFSWGWGSSSQSSISSCFSSINNCSKIG